VEEKPRKSDSEAWIDGINRQHLAYLLYLKLRGCEIKESEIEALRAEVRSAIPAAEPLNHELAELQDLLAFVDSIEANQGQAVKATLYNRGPIKLRMRPETNHARPHFHIEYKQDYSASYAVDTLELLAGSMPQKYEKPMLTWAKENQVVLLETWNHMIAGGDFRELVVSHAA
jgi:hypothetical protein